MFMNHRSFTLGDLAIDLELPVKKLATSTLAHKLHKFLSEPAGCRSMMLYNIRDCDVTIELCFKMDLINQMVFISFTTKSIRGGHRC
jgi:hypothetical protein